MDRRAMMDKKPLSIIVAKKEGKLEVFEIARQNLEKEIGDLKLILGNKSALLSNLNNMIAEGRDGIATLKSQCEKDTLNSSREGDTTMDERIEKLRGKIKRFQTIRKMTNFIAHWINLGLHNRNWAAIKSSLGLEEYEVMEEAFWRCDTADMRSETIEEDMEAAEEREKGADDPSDSTPLCSKFEGCDISTASISDTQQ